MIRFSEHYSNDINNELKNGFIVQGSQPSKLYGLPKIHKEGIPMRPVLSMIGSAQYQVAKILERLLKPLVNNPLECKDSFEFVNRILNWNIESDREVMVSFDIVNLFTNIPLNETINLCVKLWDNLVEDKTKSLSSKALRELLEFSTKNVPFIFNEEWFMQTDGIAMGSPLAPLMASIFLHNLEQKFNNFNGELPLFYTRYVDDTFLIFKGEDNVSHFLEFVNGLHPNIKFTFEMENTNKLSFLDVLIERIKDKYQTRIYRKPTDTGLYSCPNSFSDPKYNRNMIKGLVHRVWGLTSTFEIFDNEVDELHNRLSKNGFNKKYLNKIIKDTVESIYLKSNNTSNITSGNDIDNQMTFNLKLPYSERAKEFKRFLEHRTPIGLKLRVIFVTNKCRNYFSNKSKTPLCIKANLVYQFKCHKCEALYIGETSRHLRTRIAEHTQSSRNSSVLSHIKRCKGNLVDYNKDFKVILNNFDTNYERIIAEALLIKHHKPCLNVQGDSSNHIKVF